MDKINKQSADTLEIQDPLKSGGLYPNPEELLSDDRLDLNILKYLVGQSVISSKQFDKKLVSELCKFASLLEATEVASSHPLDGKIVITAFFEASTRTRTSFESAVLRLDGKIISIAEGKMTGRAKGESIQDIGEMFNAYGDLVIMRNTRTEAPGELMERLRLPLINAGNGTGEHPTQALSDWYALLKWRPELKSTVKPSEKINMGILGTPGRMRAVKSFLYMSLLFKENINNITIVSEMADPLGEDVREELEKSGVEFSITNDLNKVIGDLDVIYMNSITLLGDSYQNLDSRYKLSKSSNLKKEAVILHPLARLDELSTDLDETSHNLYFTQAHGAVFIRQALLISMLNRFDHLPDTIPTK